jgi:hypothetical protein
MDLPGGRPMIDLIIVFFALGGATFLSIALALLGFAFFTAEWYRTGLALAAVAVLGLLLT